MYLGFGSRIRHPLLPGIVPTPAREAKSVNVALCGTLEEILRVAEAGARVGRAIFVTHAENEPLLTDGDRDLLWDRFGVPVFAIVLNRKGRVVAYECEAQNGLHVRDSKGDLDAAVCECGRPGAKLFLRVREVIDGMVGQALPPAGKTH